MVFTGSEKVADMIQKLLQHTKKTCYWCWLKPNCHHNVWGRFLTGIQKALKCLDESCRYPGTDATDATSIQMSR